MKLIETVLIGVMPRKVEKKGYLICGNQYQNYLELTFSNGFAHVNIYFGINLGNPSVNGQRNIWQAWP